MKKFLLNLIKSVSKLKFLQGKGLRSNPVFNAFVDFFLTRLIPQDIETLEIQGSLMVMDLKNKDPSIRRTYQAYAMHRIHEPVTTEIFKKLIKEGNTVIDVGANIGYFTLLAARLVGHKGKVFSFEPEPRNFAYLTKNLELNKYKNVVARQMAVSDKCGSVDFQICKVDSGHHSVISDTTKSLPKTDIIKVETVSLDSLFEKKAKDIDFIKIDAEGSEPKVLAGMKKILLKSKKIKIIMEFYPLLIRQLNQSPEKLLEDLLKEYNFSVYIISDDYSAFSKKNLKVSSPSDVMKICHGKKSHVNLFLEKGNKDFEQNFPVVAL